MLKRLPILLSLALLLLLASEGRSDPPAPPPAQTWYPQAPPLAAASQDIIEVASVAELFQAADRVKPGGTILVNDGHYLLPSVLTVAVDGVTLRGRSGNRDAVVLDGTNSRQGELVLITGKDVTVADLTIQNIKWNGFKIASELGAQRTTIYNCVIRNIWQRGIKASHIPRDKPHLYPEQCRIQFCLFYNDRPKQFSDDPTDMPQTYNGNYVGGIDVKNTVGWTISDNVFVGIQGRTREGRAAIYISEEGRDCVIERNVIIDCDVGIALGNPSLVGEWMHAIDCVARNNFITRCPETGILACFTENCRILHNTVHEPKSRFGRLIWVQFANEGLHVANNLLSGKPMLVTSESEFEQEHNVAQPDLAPWFEDAAVGNLRLARAEPMFTDGARRLALVSHDIDNQPRLGPPSVQLDEARLARIGEIVQAAIEQGQMPGCVVLIGRQGKVAYLQAFGNRRPNR